MAFTNHIKSTVSCVQAYIRPTPEMSTGIVIDAGSSVCTAGYGGQDAPDVVFHSIKDGQSIKKMRMTHQPYVSTCDFGYPVKRGCVINWDNMEKIWHQIFKDLYVAPENVPVLLTEPCLRGKANREKMIEIMFEAFNIPAMHIAYQAVLSLFASGRSTGLVLDCGDGLCQCVPIWDDRIVPKVFAVEDLDLGGCDLTEYLRLMLFEHGYSFTTPSDLDIVRNIKENFCYVSTEDSFAPVNMSNYTLPDNLATDQVTQVTMGSERFRCPEALFSPSLLRKDLYPGIHNTCYHSILNCGPQYIDHMLANIVLSGGSTMFPGFAERLSKELNLLAYPSEAKIIAPPERNYSVWRGGSKTASLPSFMEEWCFPRKEYDEYGSALAHRNHF